MKLFISWSGEFSGKVAECLSIWIPTILQTVDVFYSPDDIAKGENWSNRLSDELEQSNFGIICLTPENILAPWIHFEAGALSKTANSRVSAIMLGISPSDVKGPLARFQNTAFTREDFYRLFLSINSSLETPLKRAVLDHAFDNSWERLEHDVSTIIEKYLPPPPLPSPKESRLEHDVSTIIEKHLPPLPLPSPKESVLDEHSSNQSRQEIPHHSKCTVSVACPPAYIEKVASILLKYSPRTNPTFILQNLRNKAYCQVSIPTSELNYFFAEIYDSGAEII